MRNFKKKQQPNCLVVRLTDFYIDGHPEDPRSKKTISDYIITTSNYCPKTDCNYNSCYFIQFENLEICMSQEKFQVCIEPKTKGDSRLFRYILKK